MRIEPRPKAGTEPAHTEAWRDMQVSCWYEAEPVPPARRSTRQRDKFEREPAVFRAKNMRYYCDIKEADEFGKWMWGTGCAVKADLVPELVFVCDGAVWIWNLIQLHYPHAVQSVDWYHAADRLKRVALAAFPALSDRTPWLERITADLWAGRVTPVIQACEQLASRCEEARQAVTYFTHHTHRMKYDQFRAAGYLLAGVPLKAAANRV